MAEAVTVASGIGWGIKAAGWIASPIISELFKKASPYLGLDTSVELSQLETKVLLLELVMGMVEESTYRPSLQKLFKDLKSAFYEAEDILDDVEYHRLKEQIKSNKMKPRKRDKVKKKLQGAMPSFCLKDQESGMSKIKLKQSLEKIKKVITDTCEVLERMNLPSTINANRSHLVPASSRCAVTTSTPPLVVIGRDGDCDKIAAMLHQIEEDGEPDTFRAKRFSVIGIHGIGGSGKSTLAQLVCARAKIDMQEKKVGHFALVMWVHVSQDFSVNTIFREIIEAATGTSCTEFCNLDTLQNILEKELHGKRFLLVLDDVWYNNEDVSLFEMILSPLNACEAGSKILVTSRTEDALLALGAAKRRCIPISDLGEDVFQNLFMHYALHGTCMDDHVRKILEDIGKDIAKKLKGSPLAAKLVGGQLRLRQTIQFWAKVRDRDIWNETMGAVWWSYQHLDEKARRCFTYCSIFPRKRWLIRDELVRMWAAEGFGRSTNEGEDMEDVCQEYFDKLVSASFLQLGEGGYIVHDLLRDLAEKVAGSDCFRIENHEKLIKAGFGDISSEWIIEGSDVEVPPDARHVFVQTYDAALITKKICKLENLRTLIIENTWMAPVEEKVLESMFGRLKKLRVLSIAIRSDFGQKKLSVPASISQLRHVRYLAFVTEWISINRMKLVLPSTLSKLYHMEVLNFGCSDELMLTSCKDMCNFINLRHAIYSNDLKIRSIGRLTSLRTMGTFIARKEQGYQLKELGNLNKLVGELRIYGLENVESKAEALEAKLADKEGLKKMVLRWDGQASAEVETEVLDGLCLPKYLDELLMENYKGLRYPSWMVGENGGPKHLKQLELCWCSPELGPELRGFGTHLRRLTIQICSWNSLPDYMEHLTSLHELCIWYCENIRSLPTLPQSLQKFSMTGCNDVLMSCCTIIGDPNWEKIQHIPRAYIGDCAMTLGKVVTRPEEARSEVDDSSSPEVDAWSL